MDQEMARPNSPDRLRGEYPVHTKPSPPAWHIRRSFQSVGYFLSLISTRTPNVLFGWRKAIRAPPAP